MQIARTKWKSWRVVFSNALFLTEKLSLGQHYFIFKWRRNLVALSLSMDNPASSHEPDAIDLALWLRILWKRKIVIPLVMIPGVLASYGIGLYLDSPVKYRATASILLVPEGKSSVMAFIGSPEAVSQIEKRTSLDPREIVTLMSSHEFFHRVLERVRGANPEISLVGVEEDMVGRKSALLVDSLLVTSRDIASAIDVVAQVGDPRFAATLANAYVDEVDRLMKEYSVGYNLFSLSRASVPSSRFRRSSVVRINIALLSSFTAALLLVFLIEGIHRPKEEMRKKE